MTATQSIKKYFSVALVLAACNFTQAQFTPVPLNGFTQDVVAESGTSSLTTTTMPLDASVASNKVMYTSTFRANLGFGGGGLPDNGTIVNGADSYQLSAYNANNALVVQRNQNADINITTPAKFSVIRVLAFSTEGSSLLNVKLTFTDGTFTNALTNYSLGDWFNNTANLVTSGFGRCTRATPASGADGYSTNPRMYYVEITMNCADKNKNLQKINFANVTTAGTNAPYPNTVIMAVSGKAYVATSVSSSVTNANCSGNGSATLTITGSSTPYSVSWNTTPAQSGLTATNLTPGTYTATITDGSNCVSTTQVTIGQVNNLTMSNRLDTSICFGASFSPNITSNASSYTWSPTAGVGNPAVVNPILSPTVTTTYTVTGTTGLCTVSRTFTVLVAQAINVNAGNDVTILTGSTVQLNGSGPSGTYLWTPPTGLSSASILNPVASPTVTTTYTLRITTSAGCTNTDDVIVNVIPYCVKPLNAFSPNGDGINDKWFVTNGNCTTNIKATVFNRYGSKVFESTDYRNTWDGTYQGKPLPDGTYYYTLTYTLLNASVVMQKGDVTILR